MSRYQPFILAGGGLLISQHGTDHSLRYGYRLGLGVDVFVTDAFYLSMSYRYTGNLDDYGYTSLLWGIGYQL
jgi:opacity protein-like surface antigen